MKGNLGDLIFITIFFLMFCMSTLLAFLVYSEMSPPLSASLAQATGGTLTSGAAFALSQTEVTLLMFDSLFIFMIIGSYIAIMISCFYLDTHPVFFIISFLVFLFSVVIIAVLGNVFSEFASAEGMQAAAANFPLMASFWQNAPTIFVIFAAITIVVIYAKIRGKPVGGSPYGS